MNLLAAYRTWRTRAAVRADYYDTDRQLGDLHDQLRTTAEPRDRSKLYRKMADLQIRNAGQHFRAFGPDPIPQEDGRDLSDSLVSASKLYRVLGDVEWVVACNGRVGRNWRFHEWGVDADEILDRMCTTPNLLDRVEMLDDLYDAVAPAVGGQAAEVLAVIALDDKVVDELTGAES